MTVTQQPTPATTTAASSDQKNVKAMLGTGLPSQNPNVKERCILNESNVERVLGDQDVALTETLYFKDCSDSHYTITAACTKIFVESCQNLKLDFQGRVFTSTVELWKCKQIQCRIATSIQTLQLDMSEHIDVCYTSTGHFNRLVWSSVEQVSLKFEDAPEHQLTTGSTAMQAMNANIQPETDQFIVRLVQNKVTGRVQLLNELIVRLENGFPTTEREAKAFEERQEANLQALARELLGPDVRLGKKKDAGPKVKPNESCPCGSSKKYKKCCGSQVHQ